MKIVDALRIPAVIVSLCFFSACTKQTPGNIVAPVRASAAASASNQTEVIYSAGDVTATSESGTTAVEIGDVLVKGQSVKTGALSECELQLGNKTAIRIESNTIVWLDEALLKPGERNIDVRTVLGTVLCKVDTLSADERFRVRTPNAVCSVRGTEFSVTVSEGNDTLLAVKQGRVGMLPASLDMEKLTAELKSEDPDVKAALAALSQSELVVGEAQEAVVTEAASRQVEESVKELEAQIAGISAKEKPSAAEKERFKAAVGKTEAAVKRSFKPAEPVKADRIKALEKIEDLKSRMIEERSARPQGSSVTAAPQAGGPEPGVTGPSLLVWARRIDPGDNVSGFMRALEDAFIRKNPDLKVAWEVIEADALEPRVQTALAADQGPDVFQTYGGELLRRQAASGKLLDVTEELSGIMASDVARSIMSFNDRLYGIAPVIDVGGLYVNEGIFGRLGLGVPEDMGEMENAANVLKANGVQPFACGAKDGWPPLATYMYLVNRFGGDAYEQAKQRRMSFTSAPFLMAGQKIKEWAEKGFYGDNPMGETYQMAKELMKTGKAAMMVSGSWMCKELADWGETGRLIRFHRFPIVIGGMGDGGDFMSVPDVAFAARNTAGPKRDVVLRFLRYAGSMEARLADPGLVYSIPGVGPASPCAAEGNLFIAQARTVQLWWDLDLPPILRKPVQDVVSGMLAPGTDVQISLSNLEELTARNLGPVR